MEKVGCAEEGVEGLKPKIISDTQEDFLWQNLELHNWRDVEKKTGDVSCRRHRIESETPSYICALNIKQTKKFGM